MAKLKLGKKVQKCIRKSTYILKNNNKIEGYTARRLHPDNRHMITANFLELKEARKFVKGGKC